MSNIVKELAFKCQSGGRTITYPIYVLLIILFVSSCSIGFGQKIAPEKENLIS